MPGVLVYRRGRLYRMEFITQELEEYFRVSK